MTTHRRGRPIRVGLLLHGLDRPLTGVTRVALELARALLAHGDCELTFLATHRPEAFDAALRDRSVYLPGCRLVPGVMALGGPLVAVAARRLQLDVIHDPVGVSPFTLGRWAGSFKRVLTIHDAIAFRFPEGYSWANNFLHRRFVPHTLRHVDGVVTVSNHARAELERFLDIAPERIWVVPNAVSGEFRPIDASAAAAVCRRYGLADPFVLYVGSRQRRKNLHRLLTAFERLRERLPAYQLAIVGPASSEDELERRIETLARSGAVRLVGVVPDEDLPAIYSAARVFVFPSMEEGFGLPILEAMACGTPVVCSDATSLPEVAGDAALLVNAADAEAICNGMWRVVTDGPLADSLQARGLLRTREFTWDRVARNTVEVYRSVLAGTPGSVLDPHR